MDREVLVGDRWAVEKGAYEWVLKPKAGGDLLPDRGHYMQIWKLDANGNWLFAREIWNSSIPRS
jgi:hypothetical protein